MLAAACSSLPASVVLFGDVYMDGYLIGVKKKKF